MVFETRAGYEIYYETFGNPGDAPIVFVNGIFQEADSWKKVINGLKGFYAVTFDLINQGNSGETHDLVTLGQQADSIAELAAYLGLKKINVTGLSYGGMVVQRLMVHHPGIISKAILISTLGRKTIAFQNFCNTALHMASLAGGQRVFDIGMGFNPLGDIFGIRQGSWNIQKAANLIKAVEISETDYRDKLRDVNVPTLVIQGGIDVIAPVNVGEELSKSIADAQFIIIPNRGHVLNTEAPEKLTELIAGFCS